MGRMKAIDIDLQNHLSASEPITLEDDETSLEDLKEKFINLCQPYYGGKPLKAA